MALINPGNQALAIAVRSANSGNTANAQTGQIFQNATTGPYTLENAIKNGGAPSIPSPTGITQNPQTSVPSTPIANTRSTAQGVAESLASKGINFAKPATTTTTPVQPINRNLNAPTLPAATTPAKPTDWLGNGTINRKTFATPSIPGQAPLGTTQTGTKPPAQNQVKQTIPQKTASDYLNANTEKKNFADSMLKSIDPNGQITGPARDDILNAFANGSLDAITNVANAYNINYNTLKDEMDVYRATRDATLQNEYQKAETAAKLRDSKQQYDNAIRQQQQKIEADANNMAIMQDTAGRLQSRNMATAINQNIAEQQRILDNLNDSQMWAADDINRNAKYNHDVLANNYNDVMAQYDSKLLDQVKNLYSTGMSNTSEGLKAAQSLVQSTLAQKLQTGYQYAKALENATNVVKTQIAQATPSPENTKLMNDGYVYNQMGQIIMKNDGTPMMITKQTATPQQIASYARAFANGGGMDMLKQLPDNIQQQVIQYIGENGISPKKESQWGVIGTDEYGNQKYGFINTSTGTVSGYGGQEVGNTGNMGAVSGDLRGLASQYPGQAWVKNNNPAGITWNANFDNPKPGSTAQRLIDAGVKFSKGTPRPGNEGGNYVTFDTIEDGLKAQRIMISGTYGKSTVGQMLSSWVGTSEGPNYAKQVSGMAGIDPNTPVSNLTDEQLSTLQMAKIQKESPGLAKLLQGSPIQTTPQNQTYSPSQKNILEGYGKKVSSGSISMKEKGDIARQLGVKPDQVDKIYNEYSSQKVNQKTGDFSSSEINQFKTYNGNSIPEEYKTTEEKNGFLNRMNEWKLSDPKNMSKEEYDMMKGTRDYLKKSDPRYTDFVSLQANDSFLKGFFKRADENKITSQDKQALISNFAKVLDPGSVVRDSEYATTAGFTQSKIDKLQQEVSNYFYTGAPMSDEAAKALASGLKTQYKSREDAYNKAIDEAIDTASSDLGRPVTAETLGVKYVGDRLNQNKAQKTAGASNLGDFLSGLKSLIKR